MISLEVWKLYKYVGFVSYFIVDLNLNLRLSQNCIIIQLEYVKSMMAGLQRNSLLALIKDHMSSYPL